MNLSTVTCHQDGNHCIFYAAQDANIYFNRQGLSSGIRDELQIKVEQTEERFLEASVIFALEILDKNRITSSGIFCAYENAQELEQSPIVRNKGIPITPMETTKGLIAPEPLILIVADENGGNPHMWFCRDNDMWENERQKHMEETNEIVAIITLKRKNFWQR